MITCPNCNHQNPEGSVQCENCYTPLPSTSPCPNCGATVQTDATFCGQCGFNLQGRIDTDQTVSSFYRELPNSSEEADTPMFANLEPAQSPWDMTEEDELELPEIDEQLLSYTREDISPTSSLEELEEELTSTTPFGEVGEFDELPSNLEETEDLETWITSIREQSLQEEDENAEIPELSNSEELEISTSADEDLDDLDVAGLESEIESEPASQSSVREIWTITTANNNVSSESLTTDDVTTKTQLQQAVLFHLQTGNNIEIPYNTAVVHIGKPNKQVFPDIDVSSFPNSEIVSRIHADIRIEGDTYFIEDKDSSNGTYINYSPLLSGNRHRLREGDRISLGKGDLVTFIFQLN